MRGGKKRLTYKKHKEKTPKMTRQRLTQIINSDTPMEAYNYLYTKILDYLTTTYGIKAGEINKLFFYCSSQPTSNTATQIHHNFRKKVYQHIKTNKNGEHTCATCGTTGNLTFHHIKSQSTHPEDRYNPDNILLLCDTCHKQLHGLLSMKEYEEEKKEVSEYEN
jgi:5-methylcytosine-specific restriction endonuclease McrA